MGIVAPTSLKLGGWGRARPDSVEVHVGAVKTPSATRDFRRDSIFPHCSLFVPSGCPARTVVLRPAMGQMNRIAERRRAAALARHYRDQERLSIAEIARRLGRAEATIKAI